MLSVGIGVSIVFFFFSSRRRHTRCALVSSVVCSSDLDAIVPPRLSARARRTAHIEPGGDLLPLLADLRGHIPRRIGVLGSAADAAPRSAEASVGTAIVSTASSR